MEHQVMSRKFRLVILRVPYKNRAFKFLSYLATNNLQPTLNT